MNAPFAASRWVALAVAFAPASLLAADKGPGPAAAASAAKTEAPDAEAEYTRAIEKRADGVLAGLALGDEARAGRVRETLLAQYRGLRDWHDANDPELKKLKDAKDAAGSRARAEEVKASLKPLHDAFLARLSKDLTAEQVEKVKDAMTYNVVRVTYDGYGKMLPELTADQKAKILNMLKAAREEAMDGGSSDEKHAIFGRYKGRINNYLSAEGYDLKKASKEWAERERAAKSSRASQSSVDR